MSGLEAIYRAEYGRAVATLTRVLGDLHIAEDVVQEAFARAAERWPADGTPPNPGGWIVTTARRAAIDRLRRETTGQDKQRRAALDPATAWGADPQVAGPADVGEAGSKEVGAVEDDRLRLLFTCCHPALAPAAQVALTLRLLGGLTTDEIARAFLVPGATMAQRISRAKAKIRDARIPYRIPFEADLPERVSGVLAVVYLVFNEGYDATGGDALIRTDLCDEALRLARLLVELMPDEPEALGLLGLLLLIDGRRPARTDASGALVPLDHQDRARWDAAKIAEGHALVRACLRRGRPGPYQVQAAINAVHTSAASADETDWRQVLALYDQLTLLSPTPVVALNRAVALAEVEGPAAGLTAVESLALDTRTFHAVRADLLRRLGRRDEAAAAYAAAADRPGNAAERDWLLGRSRVLRGRPRV